MGAWFSTTVGGYSSTSALSKLGSLISENASAGFPTHHAAQIRSWEKTLELAGQLCLKLKERNTLSANWVLLFEYEIPRRQKRPDLVVLARDVIFVVEVKVGASTFDRAAIWQVQDYALDLRDFHSGSENRRIVPVLVATEADKPIMQELPQLGLEQCAYIAPVQCVKADDVPDVLLSLYSALRLDGSPPLDPEAWENASYRPSLDIIEAAEKLFAHHSVREISHAYADNLGQTCDALIEAVRTSQNDKRRVVCFVTGVPGSGKTLAGLSAVHDPALRREERPPGVFLSGNGPLVRIVRAALARDSAGRYGTRREANRQVSTFIQNVHTFIGEYSTREDRKPPENVIVFDEAQRAWDAKQVGRKRGIECSEAQLVLEIMSRCPDWAVIIALVGGGQEIHQGEAGLAEWGRALHGFGGDWSAQVSPEVLPGAPPRPGGMLIEPGMAVDFDLVPAPLLHLDVNVRSPRAQFIHDWVNLLLERQPHAAKTLINRYVDFPIAFTRDLETARSWLRDRARADRRCGLVASSGATRLRAFGLELSSSFRHGYPYEEWFLAEGDDVRSSNQLEVAASQFECQGLELDWVGVCWGGDLTFDGSTADWRYRQFLGSRWKNVNKVESRNFLLNRYRVLLTRAREGMVIWIPPGLNDDPTLQPEYFDRTAALLERSGARGI